MKEGDVVRIVRQPEGMLVQCRDWVGYIEEMQGDHAYVITMKMDGVSRGSGSVPLACLDIVTDPLWIAAKAARDDRQDRRTKQALTRGVSWKEHIAMLAVRHRITPDQVEDIYNTLHDLIYAWQGA